MLNLKSIDDERKKLEDERKKLSERYDELRELEHLYHACGVFGASPELRTAISTLVSEVEGRPYVFEILEKKEKDYVKTYYEQEKLWMGAPKGYIEIYRQYKEPVKGRSFSSLVLMEESLFTLFNQLTFKDVKEYELNFNIFAQNGKNLTMPNAEFQSEMFEGDFSYIADFLNVLTNWRRNNGGAELSGEVINALLIEFLSDPTRNMNLGTNNNNIQEVQRGK